MRFQFIKDHRSEFPVTRMCKELGVSPSGYYAWRDRPPSGREMANQELLQRIEAVYNGTDGTYGSPRIYCELKEQGVACSKNRIARLMRLRGLQAKQVKRYKSTTKRNKPHRAAPNLLERDFSAERPDHKWLTDITYIPTGGRMALPGCHLGLVHAPDRRLGCGKANDGRPDPQCLEDGHSPTPAR